MSVSPSDFSPATGRNVVVRRLPGSGPRVGHVRTGLHAHDRRRTDARHEVQEGAQDRAQACAHHQADPVQDLERVLAGRLVSEEDAQRDVPSEDSGKPLVARLSLPSYLGRRLTLCLLLPYCINLEKNSLVE